MNPNIPPEWLSRRVGWGDWHVPDHRCYLHAPGGHPAVHRDRALAWGASHRREETAKALTTMPKRMLRHGLTVITMHCSSLRTQTPWTTVRLGRIGAPRSDLRVDEFRDDISLSESSGVHNHRANNTMSPLRTHRCDGFRLIILQLAHTSMISNNAHY